MAWTQRKGKMVLGAAGGLVGILVTWGVVVAVTGDNDNGEEQATPTTADSSPSGPTETTETSRTGNFGELAPDPAEGNRFRFESPDNVVWYPILDGVPAEFTETRSKGFPRNEEGAALAAWHIYNRAGAFNKDGYEATIDEQVTGTDKPAMKQFADETLDNSSGDSVSTKCCAMVGYDVTFFNPLNAEVKVYAITTDEPVETRNENKLAIPIELVWEDDDWKLVAPKDGFDYGASFTALDPQFSFGGNWK